MSGLAVEVLDLDIRSLFPGTLIDLQWVAPSGAGAPEPAAVAAAAADAGSAAADANPDAPQAFSSSSSAATAAAGPLEPQFLIRHDGDWMPPQWISQTSGMVRPAMSPEELEHLRRDFDPQTGDEVEARAKADPTEPYSWWPVVVETRVVSEDAAGRPAVQYLISYVNHSDYHEVTGSELLRPTNPHGPLLVPATALERAEIPLPPHMMPPAGGEHPGESLLRDWDLFRAYVDQHTSRDQGIFFAYLYAERGVLVVAGTEAGNRRLRGLVSVYWKFESKMKAVERRAQQHASDIEQLQVLQQLHTVSFRVPAKYLDLVAGRQQLLRVQQAVPGVHEIRLENRLVVIRSLTEDAATQARRLIEVVDYRFPIPKGHVGRIVGPEFTNLREIQAHSGVFDIIVDDDYSRVVKERKAGEDGTSSNAGGGGSGGGGQMGGGQMGGFGGQGQPDDQSKSRRWRPEDWQDGAEKVDLVIWGHVDAAQDALLMLEQHVEFLRRYTELSAEEKHARRRLEALERNAGLRTGGISSNGGIGGHHSGGGGGGGGGVGGGGRRDRRNGPGDFHQGGSRARKVSGHQNQQQQQGQGQGQGYHQQQHQSHYNQGGHHHHYNNNNQHQHHQQQHHQHSGPQNHHHSNQPQQQQQQVGHQPQQQRKDRKFEHQPQQQPQQPVMMEAGKSNKHQHHKKDSEAASGAPASGAAAPVQAPAPAVPQQQQSPPQVARQQSGGGSHKKKRNKRNKASSDDHQQPQANGNGNVKPQVVAAAAAAGGAAARK